MLSRLSVGLVSQNVSVRVQLLSRVQLCATPWTIGSCVHTNIKSLCCAPETNIKLYTTYTSVKKTELAEQNKKH